MAMKYAWATMCINGVPLHIFFDQRFAYPSPGGVGMVGDVKRMEYARGGDRTAWEPAAVDVGFCVDVEGASA